MEDGVPVVDVEQAGQCLPEAVGELVAGQRRRQNQGGDQRDDHSGHEAPEAAQPEGAQTQVTLCVPGAHEVAGDEVTRQREEHADSQEPANETGNMQVIEDYYGDCDCPQPVEARYVLLVLTNRAWHVSKGNLYPNGGCSCATRRIGSDFGVYPLG